jgi:hypothetical protein
MYGSPPASFIIKDDKGQEIYTSSWSSGSSPTVVNPGETKVVLDIEWQQIDQNNRHVSPGTYFIDGWVNSEPIVYVRKPKKIEIIYVPCPWDVNKDKIVDVLDLVIVASKRNFGKSVPPAEPRADVNRDKEVNILDLVSVSKHLDETCGNSNNSPIVRHNTPTVCRLSQVHVPGKQFTVDIMAENVCNVYGFQFELVFDADVLDVMNVTEGQFLSIDGASTYWIYQIKPMDDKGAMGKIVGVCTRIGRDKGVSGSGVLASVVFRAKGYGMSKLELKKVLFASSEAKIIHDAGVKLAGSAPSLPVSTNLLQNYPNPFNPECWIPYTLSKRAHVIIKIYNITGQLIRTLDLGIKEPGIYVDKDSAAYWDGRNDEGEEVASGVYFYRLHAGDKVSTKKMVVLK